MNEKKFEIKYKLYAQMLFNICYGYTKSKVESEDLIQNIFLKYLKYNKTFKTLDDEKYYLIRTTINECKNYIKSGFKKKEIINQEIIDNSPSLQNNELAILKRTIDLLDDKYKVVIILYYYQSFNINEIANILKISISSVKKRLERGRNILKQLMEV